MQTPIVQDYCVRHINRIKPNIAYCAAFMLIFCGLFQSGCSDRQETTETSETVQTTTIETTEEKIIELTDEDVILDLLIRKDPAEAVYVQSQLTTLAERRDAIGYFANLYRAALAETESERIPHIEKALMLYESREVRLGLAELYRQTGDTEQAFTSFAMLLPDIEALEQMQQLGLPPERISTVMLEKRLWQSIIPYVQTINETVISDASRQLLNQHLAYAYVETGEFTQAAMLLKDILINEPDNMVAKRYLARAHEGLKEWQAALVLYRSLGADGAERAGAMLEKLGRQVDAAKVYAESSEPKAIWRAAQLDELSGRKDVAMGLYQRLTETVNPYRDDAAYRLYVHFGRARDTEAQQALLPVLSAFPSMQARLGLELIWPERVQTPYGKPEFVTRMEHWRQTGRNEAADIEWEVGLRFVTQVDRLGLGAWYQEEGELYKSVIWGLRAIREAPEADGFLLAYPRAFADEVAAAAAEFDLEPELLWAVMREESFFQHEILSAAGAVGLMQVMPATGKEIAASLKTTFAVEDLKVPAVSIRFGAYYLRAMLNRFGGDYDRALAAYNGGAGNVNKWLKSGLMIDKLDFPYVIGFHETREYISKVMNSYHTYRWLYGEE